MKIPDSIIPLTYILAKKAYGHEISRSEAIGQLVEAGMNRNSASDYLNNFRSLVDGKRFTRTLNVFSLRYFLDQITLDFDSETVISALSALKEHIEYFENERSVKVRLIKVRELYEDYARNIPVESDDEKEQSEILRIIGKANLSKNDLIEQLAKVRDTDPEILFLNGKAFKRNNRTIALIKVLRDFKCQICGKAIQKRDGSSYVEAAHIKPKKSSGCETLNNIILLCPNHHKEFDLGKTVINEHTSTVLNVTMNGNNFIIAFE